MLKKIDQIGFNCLYQFRTAYIYIHYYVQWRRQVTKWFELCLARVIRTRDKLVTTIAYHQKMQQIN